MEEKSSTPFRSSETFWLEDTRRIECLKALADKALGPSRNRAAELRKKLDAKAKAFNRSLEQCDRIVLWNDVIFRRFVNQGLVPTTAPITFSLIAVELFRRTKAAGVTRDAYDFVLSEGYPDIRGDFENYCESHNIEMGSWDWRGVPSDQKAEIGAAELGVEALAPFFHTLVHATQLTETQKTIEQSAFPDDVCSPEQEFRRFLIYRNSISAKRISKMYGFFRRPQAQLPYPTFAIWYKDDNGRRIETTSIILGAQQAVHLFGRMGLGLGLNLISLQRRALAETSFPGLQLSTDSNGIPIASRLLFVQTEIENDDEAKIGIISRNNLQYEDLNQSQIAMLSNRVGIERTDLTHNGFGISHETARAFVADRLADSPIVMGDLDADYNPADVRHIPFNTALYLK